MEFKTTFYGDANQKTNRSYWAFVCSIERSIHCETDGLIV